MKTQSFIHKHFFWIYLFILGLVSIFLAGFTTASYGAGVGTDGAIQLSTADHLLSGRGFYDYTEKPFVRWPPLYPLTLAFLCWLTGLETFTAGWGLNLLLFGINVWLGGALLYSNFRDEPLWAFIGSLVLATSVSLLSLSANIGTDPLFISLTLAFTLVANQYLRTKARWSLLSMALLACLASLQRLPGVILMAVTALLVIYANRENILRGIQNALIYSTVPLIPLSSWIVIHNYLIHKTFFGVYPFEATLPLANLQNSLVKIWHWFVPNSVTERISPFLLIGIPVITVVSFSRRRDWVRLSQRLIHPAAFSSLVFAGLYFLFLILTINSVDTSYAFYDRYQVVLLVPVLILIFAALQEMIFSRVKQGRILARLFILAVFAAWLTYPVYVLYKYARVSRAEGVATYNIYNTRAMHESIIVRRLLELSRDGSREIYSNYPAAAWFYTHQSILESPRGLIIEERNIDELTQAYQGWPWNGPGYLVWFLPNEYDHVLEPRDLARLAQLTLIYKGSDGEVYGVRSRPR